MGYYVLQKALNSFNELSKKVNSEIKDFDKYVRNNFEVLEFTPQTSLYKIKYKNIIANVAEGFIDGIYDVVDEKTNDVLYKNITSEFIRQKNKTLRDIILCDSISEMNVEGDNIKFEGREDVLEVLEETFYKKRIRNTVLVGNAGCGKTKIVQELAKRISSNYIVLEWRISNLVSNTQFRGTLEAKVENVLTKVLEYNTKHLQKIVLFVDEIHTLMGSLGIESNCQSVSIQDMLKPYLTNSNIILIGATTPEEYEKTIYSDKAFRRRVCPIRIEEMSYENVKKILLNFSENLIEEELLEYIVHNTENGEDLRKLFINLSPHYKKSNK